MIKNLRIQIEKEKDQQNKLKIEICQQSDKIEQLNKTIKENEKLIEEFRFKYEQKTNENLSLKEINTRSLAENTELQKQIDELKFLE